MIISGKPIQGVLKTSGWHAEVEANMAQMDMAAAAEPMKQSPIYALYSQIAPRVEDWPVLLDKISVSLRHDYDWSNDVRSIQAPTLLVFGDTDSVRPAHAVEFFGLLGGGLKDAGWDNSGVTKSQLAILPGTTHYNIVNSPVLTSVVIPFLDAPLPG